MKPGRRIGTKKPYSHIFVHNHTHHGGLLDPTFHAVPSDQAHDANALLLGGKRDVLVTSLPLEASYLEYWTNVLKLSRPLIYSIPASRFRLNLFQSLLDNVQDFMQFLQEQRSKGLLCDQLVLSVFEAEDKDKQLLALLQQAGVGQVISECNYDLLPLGTKTAWRTFCKDNKIPQLPGGVFRTTQELKQFVTKEHAQAHAVVIKSPHGIGGLGQLVVLPDQARHGQMFEWTDEELVFIQNILVEESEILAERFVTHVESEHVVDVYIDPTQPEHQSSVLFDQLTKEPTVGNGGIAYYGAKYPSEHFEAKARVCAATKDSLLPSLVQAGYTGPAGVDVLYRPPHPPHFIELNMRTDAITYIKHLADRIGERLYQKAPGQTAFMTLVNLSHTMHFNEIKEKFASVLQPSEQGVFVITNPNRHRWGLYDVAAMSPLGIHVAEGLMKKSLISIWGEDAAHSIFANIHRHPTPLLSRQGSLESYPYLVSLPHDYDDSWESEKRWPVILFLHGMDERGSGLDKVRLHGIPKAVQQHKDFPFISVSPQCPEEEEHWDITRLIKLLDEVVFFLPISLTF
jgi:hypothetical protein